MRRSGYNKIAIFAEQEASDFLERVKSSVRHTIESESDDYLLNVNEENYLDHLVDRFSIEPLKIDIDHVYVTSHEVEIPAEQFPRDFYVMAGKSYKKDIIKYHIPFSGNPELLRCVPNPRIMWSVPVEIESNEITFDIVNFRNDPEHIKQKADQNIKNILMNYEHLSK